MSLLNTTNNYFTWWHRLVERMLEEIEVEVKYEWIENFKITYMKEKYWSLRVEYEWWNKKVDEIISKYEVASYEICQECWKKWRLRSDLWWISTLCDKHYNEKKPRRINS